MTPRASTIVWGFAIMVVSALVLAATLTELRLPSIFERPSMFVALIGAFGALLVLGAIIGGIIATIRRRNGSDTAAYGGAAYGEPAYGYAGGYPAPQATAAPSAPGGFSYPASPMTQPTVPYGAPVQAQPAQPTQPVDGVAWMSAQADAAGNGAARTPAGTRDSGGASEPPASASGGSEEGDPAGTPVGSSDTSTTAPLRSAQHERGSDEGSGDPVPPVEPGDDPVAIDDLRTPAPNESNTDQPDEDAASARERPAARPDPEP